MDMSVLMEKLLQDQSLEDPSIDGLLLHRIIIGSSYVRSVEPLAKAWVRLPPPDSCILLPEFYEFSCLSFLFAFMIKEETSFLEKPWDSI